MQQHTHIAGASPPVYLLADLRARPTGHAPGRISVPFVRWAGTGSLTDTVERARRFSSAELDGLDLDGFIAVPERLALRLALPARPGADAGTVVINHAHLWTVLDGLTPQAAAA